MINNIPCDSIGILHLILMEWIKAGYIIVKKFVLISFENRTDIFEEIGYNISE